MGCPSGAPLEAVTLAVNRRAERANFLAGGAEADRSCSTAFWAAPTTAALRLLTS